MRVIGAGFGLSLAVVVLLAGPLLLFNPWFTSAIQARHDVAARFGVPRAEIDRVTAEILGDIYLDGAFDATLAGAEEPLLDPAERAHMADVARLVRLLAVLTAVALVVATLTAIGLRHEPRRQASVMVAVAGVIGALALVLALTFIVAFEAAFLAFHAIFFPPGTYLFAPDSELIGLFPTGFWFDAALAAGAAVVLSAGVVAVVGLWRWRSVARA